MVDEELTSPTFNNIPGDARRCPAREPCLPETWGYSIQASSLSIGNYLLHESAQEGARTGKHNAPDSQILQQDQPTQGGGGMVS